jgi:hypothetical protein
MAFTCCNGGKNGERHADTCEFKPRDKAYGEFWCELTKQGDPERIPNKVRKGFNAGWDAALHSRPKKEGKMPRTNPFEGWWQSVGKFFDPDTSEVPWFDKRKDLAEYAFRAGWQSATDEKANL